MADIRTYLQRIKDAKKGEEVRGSIHDAIEAINEESVIAKEVAIDSKDSALNSATKARQSADEALDTYTQANERSQVIEELTDMTVQNALTAENAKTVAVEKADHIDELITQADLDVENALQAATEAKDNAEIVKSALIDVIENKNEAVIQANKSEAEAKKAEQSAIEAEESAKQAAAIAGIGIMTDETPGIGRPDADTVFAEQGVLKVPSINEAKEGIITKQEIDELY